MDISRRRFLKQTIGYSAAAALAGMGQGCGALALKTASTTAPTTAASALARTADLLAVGDFGVKDPREQVRQRAVAQGMASYLTQRGIRPTAMALLGDNFYGGLGGKGVASPRWEQNIEGMYPPAAFPCPLYAMLGNHDYRDEKASASAVAQLEYRSQNPNSRWTMPAKWYRFELPAADGTSLVTTLVLDTNYIYGPSLIPPDEQQKQLAWLAEELDKPRVAPWLFVAGHHPIFSDGTHGDSKLLLEKLDPLLRKHRVDLYIAGHDHDLQHLEFADHPTSFVISGAGGAHARQVGIRKRDLFGQAIYGFTHIQIRPEQFTLRHVDANGTILHEFAKTPAGNG